MNSKPHMIAAVIKEGRLAKGYTQKELAELARVSLRSVQRLENAQLMPRSFTLKTIAAVLDIPFERLNTAEETGTDAAVNQEQVSHKAAGRAQKVVLSIGLTLALLLLAGAYISQSRRFPETNFEALLFWAVTILLITSLLLLVWRNKKNSG